MLQCCKMVTYGGHNANAEICVNSRLVQRTVVFYLSKSKSKPQIFYPRKIKSTFQNATEVTFHGLLSMYFEIL